MAIKDYCESKLVDEDNRKKKKLQDAQDAEKKRKAYEAFGKEKQARKTNKKN